MYLCPIAFLTAQKHGIGGNISLAIGSRMFGKVISCDTYGNKDESISTFAHCKIFNMITGKDKIEQARMENQEWVDSLKWLMEHQPEERVQEIFNLMHQTARDEGMLISGRENITDYRNTISPESEAVYPGNLELEDKIHNAIRWNTMAMVVNANKRHPGIGGHISTYSSASRLFEVGFNHFFRGYDKGEPDIVFFQGHASPGVYARSFLEHRLDEEHMDGFRRELSSGHGLPSYPHPRSMREYWRYPTVSMGLSPMQAIYQARYLRYLENRGLRKRSEQMVWAFLGDGEMDEPESTGALTIAACDKLDNLIFVINCNLQRLDGPVRGNANIVNELESLFKGAGWTVVKALWGSTWDPLFDRDKTGALVRKFNAMHDGEFQRMAQYDGAGLREHFFNTEDELKDIADTLSDDDLDGLVRGGHDPVKIYNAYQYAIKNWEGPTVILAQTVKGFGQSDAGEASNVTHKKKVFDIDELEAYRDTLGIPIEDEDLEGDVPYYRFDRDSEEYEYLKERRDKLDGWLPYKKDLAGDFTMPDQAIFESFYDGSGVDEVTTTGAFVQLLAGLLKDEHSGRYVIPIVPDESRTFGMDALFSKAGIYSSKGQKYDPVDKGSLLYYNEEKAGVIIEEGISEAGSMATFIAAGTNHLTQNFHSVPFFVYYSMFGFQRIGDFIWAASDAGARGFLIGGISGRTSLSGEGLQHADGQSQLYALANPALRAFDPAFAYELAVIIQDGMKRMYQQREDLIYYLTVTNQSYRMPARPEKADGDILRGMYCYRKSRKRKNRDKAVNLLGSGAIMTEVLQARKILENEHDIPAHVWSVTSYKALYDEACATEAENMERPEKNRRTFIESSLQEHGEIFIAASDYVRAVPLSIANWIPGTYSVLGTDGFGTSDTVPALRAHFGVDAKSIVHAALHTLVRQGALSKKILERKTSV
jgi:pyruvate dehydrogenase E1 component